MGNKGSDRVENVMSVIRRFQRKHHQEENVGLYAFTAWLLPVESAIECRVGNYFVSLEQNCGEEGEFGAHVTSAQSPTFLTAFVWWCFHLGHGGSKESRARLPTWQTNPLFKMSSVRALTVRSFSHHRRKTDLAVLERQKENDLLEKKVEVQDCSCFFCFFFIPVIFM